MKPGSIVECINAPEQVSPRITPPKTGGVYTVRDIFIGRKDNVSVGIYLEEIVNPICQKYEQEYGFNINRFRELLPPMDILEVIENNSHQLNLT